jgi:hypothetical protein
LMAASGEWGLGLGRVKYRRADLTWIRILEVLNWRP